MRQITQEELAKIQSHLAKKPFKYEEVFNEVLDHYATAYETSEVALNEVIFQLDQEFTNEKIMQINAKYFDDLRKSLRKSQWTVISGNFRWPKLVYTLLLGAVFFLAAPFLMQTSWLVKSIFVILAAGPVLLGLYYYLTWVVRRARGKTLYKNAHAELFGVALGLSILYVQTPNIVRLFGDKDFNMFQHDPLLTAVILFIGAILFSTSIQITITKLHPALK